MQPVWGIPSDRIQTAARRLKELAGGSEDEMWLYPWLFLCGMKYGLTRFSAEQPVGHTLDDGLDTATKRTLTTLIRIAKSRRIKEYLKLAGWQPPGSEFAALKFAYLHLEEQIPATVYEWLRCGDIKENRCRLAVGMGARVSFDTDTYEFAAKLRRANFVFKNFQQKDFREEVKAIVEGFSYDPSWALPV